MKALRRLEKEAHAQRKTGARARRMMLLVRDEKDQDRIRRFADECDHRAAVLERKIKRLHHGPDTGKGP
jgi:hypothetical protein